MSGKVVFNRKYFYLTSDFWFPLHESVSVALAMFQALRASRGLLALWPYTMQS